MAAVMTRTPEASVERDDDDFAHYVCCRNADISFCGVDMTGYDWVEDDAEICVDCQLIAGSPGMCPFGGKCPE